MHENLYQSPLTTDQAIQTDRPVRSKLANVHGPIALDFFRKYLPYPEMKTAALFESRFVP